MTPERSPSTLSPAEKRRLVAARLAGMRAGETGPGGGPVVLPLSAQQRGIWFAEQASPGLTAYHICRSIRVDGPLQVAELHGALTDLTARHEALRTTFAVREGVPLQHIAGSIDLPLPLTDASQDADPAGDPDAERTVARITRAECERAFDLAAGPLLRCRLLRLSPRRHRLLLTLHHIIADGRTVDLLLRDLGALYAARLRGADPQLPPAAPYRAHTLEHRAWLAGPRAARSLAYWKERTAGVPPLELPTDRPRTAAAGRRGALVPLELPAEVMRGLKAVSGSGPGATGTVFPALLAAFATVVHRWTGQDDFAVGVPVAGRGRAEWWDTAGLFADFQPLRADLSGNPAFRTATARIRQALLSGIDHARIPFDRLVEELRPPRLPGRTPVFDIACSLIPGHHEELPLPGLDTFVERVHSGSAKLDLTLELAERPDGGAAGHLEYDRGLFDESTARRIADHLTRLARAGAAGPGTAIGALDLLGAQERRELLLLGTPEPSDYPAGASVAELFRDVAARLGEKTAVAPAARPGPGGGPDEALTYRALDQWSDAVAAALTARGVRRGMFVGVAGGRSVPYVVALLGILKCGAAYVPLDLSQPVERTRQLIEAAGPVAVVDTGAGRDAARTKELGVPVLPLPAAPGSPVPDAPRTAAGGDDPAYVMFTSGSTGVPKGVAVPHRAIVRLVRGGTFAEMTEDERWLSLAPPEFDASTLELWAPLLGGGLLLIGPPGAPDLQGLGALIERSGTTSLWLTAGLFHAMAEENPQGLRGLRRLLAGGDVLSPRQVRAALEAVQGPVVNGYGPTENTTFTTCHVMNSAADVGDPVPIGRPVEGTTVYLVDSYGNLVPRGAVGELWTGGDGVALGYLGDPARTAGRFPPDPFGPEPGRRLYRTGDLARWRTDGTLEFLGRADGQIKLRGYRIEPGEVESALTAHPGAAQAAVAVRPLPHGDKQLTAWVVPADARAARPGPAADRLAEELRDWLTGRLAAHLVPGRLVLLDRLPLGPTGKVDRRALPDPARGPAQTSPADQRPRPGTEELLAALFAQVLGVRQVGRRDDFFRLGGHSLAALRLTARIRSWFGAELPVSAVFAAPSVAGLAVAVDAARGAGRQARPPVHASGQESGPLSHAQERLWYLHLKDASSAAYTVPLDLELVGPVRPQALAEALRAVVDRHPALRTAVDDSGPDPQARIVPPGDSFVLERADLSRLDGRLGKIALRDTVTGFFARPFDLTRAPLLRALLVTVAPDRSRLLLAVHHIAADGAGVAVLLRDLAGACTDPGSLPAADPAAPTGIDFARAQRELLAGPARAELAAHWRRRLAALALPAPSGGGTGGDPTAGEVLRVTVPAGILAALRATAAAEGVTVHMAVSAAVALLLAGADGGEVVLGTPMADRPDGIGEDQIGLFLNTVPVRVDLRDRPSFREALGRVRQSLLDAARHAALPYEQIAELAGCPDGDAANGGDAPDAEAARPRGPLVGTVVQVQPALPARFRFGAAEATLRPAHHGTAKFDLTLSLFDDGTELSGFWEYRTAVRSRADVERLHTRLVDLLLMGGADPGARPGADGEPPHGPASQAPAATAPPGERAAGSAGTRSAGPAPASAGGATQSDAGIVSETGAAATAPDFGSGSGAGGAAAGAADSSAGLAARSACSTTGPAAAPGAAFASGSAGGAAAPGAASLAGQAMGRGGDSMAGSATVPGAGPAPGWATDADACAGTRSVTETVGDIWQELLGGPRPGPDDDFFALGGSSITATRVISRLRRRTGREVPLRDLYDHPRLAGFAARAAAAPPTGDRPPLVRTGADRGPLSFGQLRHWVLDRLEPGSSANNIPLILRLTGPLDRTALEQALGAVAARQAALRTVFADHEGVPEQRLLPPSPLTLTVHDMADEQAAVRHADQEADVPFDLTAGPPWRAGLLRLAEREHWLLLTLHHIIADGWSASVLLDDLSCIYAQFTGTGAGAGTAPAVQYLDHAIRQRTWLADDRLDAELAHWSHLRGTPPLELPAPATGTTTGTGTGTGARHAATVPLSLPATWRREAERLAAEQHASLYMLLLTVWAATLRHHTGQRDFAVGTYTAGRDDTALEGLVGFFVNNLALRCDLSGDPDWRTLLSRIRAVCTHAFAHQDVPFEKVLEAAGAERSTGSTPLFQTLCVLQNYPAWPDRMGELRLDLVRRPYERADFAVTLWLRPDGRGGLTGGLDHDTDVVDEATARRMADSFLLFADAAATGLGTRPRDALPAPGPVRPALPAARGPWLHERTADQAARTPDAPALIEYDPAAGTARITTHGELDRAANRLAHQLRALAVGPETKVAVLSGRSVRAVTAFLAVLKAGGGYVPIDPGYPPARIRTLLEDSGAALVLGSAGQLAALAPQYPALALDEPGAGHEGFPDTPPAPDPLAAGPGDGSRLAYAIYTSGSTGRPKAVAVSHANLAGYLDAIGPELALRRGDRVLNFASVSFDASVEELYPALAAGAAVVLRPEPVRTPGSDFDALLAQTRPTVLSLPVSFWHAWVERMGAEGQRVPDRVHTLLLNAEEPAPARYRDWLRLCDAPVRWINTYGPTEATVTATLHEPGPPADVPPERFPIGALLANATAHILDAQGFPVPPGTAGELHLGGHGVARGYLGRPAATARAWRPDPFSSEPGARLYRTGDRVRELPCGELEFLGRLDQQVKIRGHRVEPGEVEAALAAHPAVRQCAVLPCGPPEALRLVAYVAPVRPDGPAEHATDPGPNPELDPARLRRDLADRLPEPLVPSRILLLDALPLTPNAKVDRAALAARLERDLRAAPDGNDPGRTLTPDQELLASVWREVLGLDRIRPDDNFFTLGGDSLLAVQVAVRSRAVGFRLEPRDLFRHRTLAELAESATSAAAGRAEPEPAPPPGTTGTPGPAGPPVTTSGDTGPATRLGGDELADLMARLKGR